MSKSGQAESYVPIIQPLIALLAGQERIGLALHSANTRKRRGLVLKSSSLSCNRGTPSSFISLILAKKFLEHNPLVIQLKSLPIQLQNYFIGYNPKSQAVLLYIISFQCTNKCTNRFITLKVFKSVVYCHSCQCIYLSVQHQCTMTKLYQ